MDPIILRSLERIIAVLIGGLSMYLGYRLFLNMREQPDSEGHFSLPGGISIYLTRVGPGVFFALFGAIVIALSLYTTVTFRETSTASTVEFSGAGQTDDEEDRQGVEVERSQLKQDIFFLNRTLPSILPSDMSADEQVDVKLAVPRIKLGLMKTVWDEDWGDYKRFEDLALLDALDTASKEIKRAAIEYYQHGQAQ